ncbi:bifunctional (p)ppGpp synthetase/guanosine-3',5'-bis(diphosphate) 3'-pyrophosphohydrolase [Brevibacillus laterosporus]|uniref:GTP pyrophosphokinase n=1 Tax=Brevibacillus laterosporus TaxID=1465 RepID=A0A502IFE3_BRELA|nr:bifunctional (p)ppGpp synthetase/guanosine-3',5'-bis(diphosphate) 3'-pyrophosphohydrolase [Brevibacillus laterosporus]QDX93131.1 bifunctional (p)ppGpp synthetase/guanosine-3',5'-bis(diphosphate) 3'-pyrophosphohydrolase [Brevibacillus laterosporus]RAP27092.1 GTP pyrophosphokinase, (p)ppGpp synthetase I [Brevibacillus laterosporus]TPG72864.1 bifunctional (p)ppGpp synthetase/guanosine-3',5'-bis(diphosphate) 3'-pyrophosphohydrolase [Brevibacillus laterosporus]TPG84138.1 bifunctional (p)ppGpp syn
MTTGIEEILSKANSYMSDEDVTMLERAYDLARKAHEGQVRKSGVPYIMHPIAVAGILTDMHMDAVTVAAGFLHDVVEDTEFTLDDLRKDFGSEVAHLVDGVTKLEKIKYKSKEEQLAENHRKMLVAMAQDIRVILIKLADRLHNMRTLRHMSEEKQREISDETLEIFAPLAHRLGIAFVKWELEDTALRYLNPQQYYRIVNLMQKKRTEREEYITEAKAMITDKLDELHIEAEIAGRPKHIYSIYKKMVSQNKQFNEIYDLLALRIIVNDIRDCYAVLGIVHTLWKPMPGRFKDYIAMPKANMYQSLHTTVIGPKGEPLEVQIRTWEMHRTAEIGIAAHWAYKEGKGEVQGSFEEKIGNLREIIQGGQEETPNAQEFMESLKQDLFSDTVFIFTPKGDVVELPKGSVPLDFAYRIHSAVGNRTIGAKVNGKIVPLDFALRTGDIMEILTSKHSYGPSQDWLKIAKSAHARNKIKQWFKKEKREENVAKGLSMIEAEVKARGFDLKETMTTENVKEAATKFNFQSDEDMYSAVGYGGLTSAQVANRLTEKIRRDREEQQQQAIQEFKSHAPAQKQTRSDTGIRVEGVDNLLTRISRCCSPVPGDDIIGFITRGRGVSIHRKDCPNVTLEENDRLIPVQWEGDQKQNYNVDIEITGHDRTGLLNDVLHVVGETKTNIAAVSGKADRNRVATINMTICINNIDHLHRVVERIKRIKDIYSVRRILNT